MITTLYFVRHAEAEGNISRRFHGQFDSDITPNGEKQLELLSGRFRNIEIDSIYSSDLIRAYKTAESVSRTKNLPIITDKRLREINGGRWEDILWDDLGFLFPESYEDFVKYPHRLKMPGGETMVEFQKRLIDAVNDIVKANEGKRVCIVSHGTAIKTLMCYFDNTPLSDFPKRDWHDNTSISTVEYEDGAYRIISEGDNSHLGCYSTFLKQTWWMRSE